MSGRPAAAPVKIGRGWGRCLPALLLAGASCSRGSGPSPVYLDDFTDGVAVHCDPLSVNPGRSEVTEVSTPGDSAVLVLYGPERRVELLGPDLQRRWMLDLEESGPRGVSEPMSAAVAGDSLLLVTDGRGRRIKRLSLEGRDRGEVRVDFSPMVVRQAGSGVLVTAYVYGRLPGRLVYAIEGDRAVPLDVPAAPFADMSIKGIANVLALSARGDGSWVAAHSFLVPTAFRGRGTNVSGAVAVPLPAATRYLVDHVPEPPVTDEVVSRIAVVASAIQLDARTGDVLYVTRTGRRLPGGHLEKAVVRADSAFRFRGAFAIDANAVALARLSSRRDVVVVDDSSAWWSCPVPP